ncbi:hypothetical protein TL16_g04687 [Triparma laevis f. inornata]|uniref:Uncharacterized protein n=2 Tax=Triparma laevis TaxID=1534972 RepID=A0A9W7EHJ5_9STRA|nr:hypothetical protein TL16_g04687 [Triparma laevis f. inornata]GMH77008.1 hypothetical protein TrLO_g5948 [Triparma laevis f. longispina]
MSTSIPLLSASASSTLPPKKEHNASNLLSSDLETAWYSKNLEPGSKHRLEIKWSGSKTLVAVGLMFQGGFAGSSGTLSYLHSSTPLSTLSPPNVDYEDYEEIDSMDDFEDSNSMQIVGVEGSGAGEGVIIELEGSTDFYGRVICYRIICWEA